MCIRHHIHISKITEVLFLKVRFFSLFGEQTRELILQTASQSIVSVALLRHCRLLAPISSVQSFCTKCVTEESEMYIKSFIRYRVPSDKPNVHEETIQVHSLTRVYIRKKQNVIHNLELRPHLWLSHMNLY